MRSRWPVQGRCAPCLPLRLPPWALDLLMLPAGVLDLLRLPAWVLDLLLPPWALDLLMLPWALDLLLPPGALDLLMLPSWALGLPMRMQLRSPNRRMSRSSLPTTRPMMRTLPLGVVVRLQHALGL